MANSLNNLALLYGTQGHYALAEAFFERALTIKVRKEQGWEHGS